MTRLDIMTLLSPALITGLGFVICLVVYFRRAQHELAQIREYLRTRGLEIERAQNHMPQVNPSPSLAPMQQPAPELQQPSSELLPPARVCVQGDGWKVIRR